MVVHIDRPAPRHFDFLVHTGLLSWSVFAQLIGVCIFVLCMGCRSSCAMTPWYSLPLESLDIIESFWSALQNCAMPRRWCEAWTALIPEASVQWASSQQNIKNIQKPFSLRSILFLQSFLSHSCQLLSSVTVGWTHPAPRRRATSCCGTSSNSSHPQTWKRAPSRDFSIFFIVSESPSFGIWVLHQYFWVR